MEPMYKGWAQLKPLNDDAMSAALVPFSFPLDTEGRYVIGSRNSDAVSLLLPEVENPDGASLLFEAVLIVSGRSEVFFERPQGNNANIAVSGEPVQSGTVWRSPLAFGATVTLGPWAYLYTTSDGLFDDQALEKTCSFHRCHVCRNSQEGLHVLACGHNICANCRREGVLQPPSVLRPVTRPLQRADRQAPDPTLEQLRHVDAILVPLHCGTCRMRITASAASSAVWSLTVNQTAKLLSDISGLDGHRPLCDNCQNKRGLINSRDYNFCETCQQMLCATCLLQWHREHKWKQRLDRLRDLDDVDQKLDAANSALAVLGRQEQDLVADEGIAVILRAGHRQRNAMAEGVHSMYQKFLQCRQQLHFIQQRKRALSHGWDESSRVMAAMFDRYVEQYQELRQYVERLRNGEVSLSLSSSSEETNETSPTATETPSTSNATSAPSANA